MDEPHDTLMQPTLLSRIPATDPEVLKRMEEARAESRHYSAIGRVAAEWSLFETVIDNAAIDLAQVEYNAGICFTAQIAGSARKLDAFIALARFRGAPVKLVSDLCKFAQDVTGVAEQRNRIVHDPWLLNIPTFQIVLKQRRERCSGWKMSRPRLRTCTSSPILSSTSAISLLRCRIVYRTHFVHRPTKVSKAQSSEIVDTIA